MKTTAMFSTLSVLLAAAVAAPAAPQTFTLKTTSSVSKFNNLCVEAYHTGAGTADAVMTPCTSKIKPEFYQNGTAIYFTGYGTGHGIVAGVQVNNGIVTYDDWGPVTVNTGEPTSNVKYSASAGFTQTKEYGGKGFIVCDWAHGGLPQLFAVADNLGSFLTSNCGEVKLIKG